MADQTKWVGGTALVGLLTNICLSAALIQWFDSASGTKDYRDQHVCGGIDHVALVLKRWVFASSIYSILSCFRKLGWQWSPCRWCLYSCLCLAAPIAGFVIFLSIYLGLGVGLYAMFRLRS